MKLFLAVFALVCMDGTASAQRWFVSQKHANERVVGLLDLPDVTANFADDVCASTESLAGRLYDTPARAGTATGVVYKRNHPEYGCGLFFKRAGTSREEELPSEESGYEIAAAVVYERRGLWFRIAVPQGSAWIERANDADFLPYPQLLSRQLAYLGNDWDGQLRQTAGFKFPIDPLPFEWKAQVPKPIEIEVLGVTRVGNDDWIHVQFTTDRCGDDALSLLKPVQGWLPAYRSDGATNAWFHSRGC
jgi:hypothetical protein